MSVAIPDGPSELKAPLGLYVNVPLELTVSKAPEGNCVAVPRVIKFPLASWTVLTESVAPELGSTSLVSKLPVVRVVSASVVKLSFSATGSWLPVIVIVTVSELADVAPRLSVAVYLKVSVAVWLAESELKAPFGS